MHEKISGVGGDDIWRASASAGAIGAGGAAHVADPLLQPLSIGGLTFRNRMVHVPTTMNLSDPLGHVTDRIVAVYETIAAGGSAATIVGATCVRRDGLINERMLGLYDDTYVIGHRDVVTAISNNGSLAGIQLFYGGLIPGLGTTTALEPGKGWIPGTVSWGPSARYPLGNPEPGVMSTSDYEDIVECYGQAARRAREAGYDFVSFHFCHGSLPHTNLSLLTNQGRNDRYADHFQLCEEIIIRTQELCGKEFPIIPRLCCDENLEGGYDIDYFSENYATRLHALGIAALDCTFGSMVPGKSRRNDVASTEFIGPGFYTPHVVNLENVRHLRRRLDDLGISIPLIGSANLGTPEHLRTMVQDGAADFAGVCRLSLDDPEYANKIARGRENEIRKSTRTGSSLLQGNIFSKGWAGSAQNASFGRDREYRLVPTNRPSRVVVVGGGSGGLEYAITAAAIGHDVVVIERGSVLGGTMDWAGNYARVPNMEMLRYQPDYHRSQVERLGIACHLNCEATPERIQAENPDIVVIATGAEFTVPEVPGLDEAIANGFAVTIDQVMAREGAVDPGEMPVIFGAAIGAELALDFALQGKSIRLFDPASAYIPANYIGSRAAPIRTFLQREGVAVECGHRLGEVDDGIVKLLRTDGSDEAVRASRLILCSGRVSRSALVAPLEALGLVVHVVGDARQPRSYGVAIHEAAYLARRI